MGGELAINKHCEAEYEWEIVDESFDHEFGVHRVVGAKITMIKVHHIVLDEWVDITDALPPHLLDEIRSRVLETVDPFVSEMMNNEFNTHH